MPFSTNRKAQIGSDAARSGFIHERKVVQNINTPNNIESNLVKGSVFKGLTKSDRVRASKVSGQGKTDIVCTAKVGGKEKTARMSLKKSKCRYNHFARGSLEALHGKCPMPPKVKIAMKAFLEKKVKFNEANKYLKEVQQWAIDNADTLINMAVLGSIKEEEPDFMYVTMIKGDLFNTGICTTTAFVTAVLADLDQDASMSFASAKRAMPYVSFTSKGNLKIGAATLKRKGGTKGADNWQIMIDPALALDDRICLGKVKHKGTK